MAILLFISQIFQVSLVPNVTFAIIDLKNDEKVELSTSLTSLLLCSGQHIPFRIDGADIWRIIRKQNYKISCSIRVNNVSTELKSTTFLSSNRSLTDDVKAMRVTGKKADVKIICNDGRIFDVHSFILMARSKIFEAMLTHDTLESINGQIVISDFKSETIEKMIHFLYTDEVEDNSTKDFELLLAADKYDLLNLKSFCINSILNNLSIDNCIDLMLKSDFCPLQELKDKIINFIVANRNKLMEMNGFEKLNLKGDLLKKLLQ
ncbi:roadkill-like protein [Leptotrombidium deliense]|uniref:Roadkill-like protein n=1 Tax=Leptotrombidium deliense TaxID=299467 RepID=A0A443S6J3_9ACAR|nr:roadkill-like protein [Leptotrombidium deliense]